MFQIRVKVSNPSDPTRSFEEKFWVDTGALYSFVPEDRLEAIGITPEKTRPVIYADGRTGRCALGEARLHIPDLDDSMTCPVVFGPRGSFHLLGATALEAFGVQADPTAQQLKPIVAIMA